MIEQVYKVNDLSSPAEVQKAFEHLHTQATSIQLSDTVPDIKKVPSGTVVVYDDGTTKRLYVRTGKDRIGYITLT